MSTQLLSPEVSVSKRAVTRRSIDELLGGVAPCEFVQPIVFDREHALARLGGLADVLQEVLEVMAAETPKMHASMKSSLERRDAVELKRSAHTLKSSASIVGAKDMVRRLKQVEEYALAENYEGAAAELVEIDQQFARLQVLLAKELGVD